VTLGSQALPSLVALTHIDSVQRTLFYRRLFILYNCNYINVSVLCYLGNQKVSWTTPTKALILVCM
jgi:hypothetical protein